MPLDFNAQTVAIKGKLYEQEIKNSIEKAKAPYADPILFKQIGIWYAYYKRDIKNALGYLERYRKSLKTEEQYNSLEFAEVCNDIGRAHTIDGSYQDDKLFFEAMGIYTSFRESITDEKTQTRITLGIAYCLHQIGLIRHREFKNELAQDYFTKACDLYKSSKQITMNLAECYHLLAVSLVRQKKYEEALVQLESAYMLEKMVEQLEGGKHYLTFITAQSIADTKRNIAALQPENAKHLLREANKLLLDTWIGQVEYYQEFNNADTDKTLAFLGDNYFAQKNYPASLDFYLASLEEKVIVYKDLTHPLVKITINDIFKLFQEWDKAFDYDWDNYKTIPGKEAMLPRRDVLTRLFKLYQEQKLEDPVSFKFLLKVSTYYNHQERDPSNALFYQDLGVKRYNDLSKNDQALLLAHRAFSYQQVLFQSKKNPKIIEDLGLISQEQIYANALSYINTTFYKSDNWYDIAYATCIKALLIYEYENEKCIKQAIEVYTGALHEYEKHGVCDDQYARAKLRTWQIMVEAKYPKEVTDKFFNELKTYWAEHRDPLNPYWNRFEEIRAQQAKLSTASTATMFGATVDVRHSQPTTSPRLG